MINSLVTGLLFNREKAFVRRWKRLEKQRFLGFRKGNKALVFKNTYKHNNKHIFLANPIFISSIDWAGADDRVPLNENPSWNAASWIHSDHCPYGKKWASVWEREKRGGGRFLRRGWLKGLVYFRAGFTPTIHADDGLSAIKIDKTGQFPNATCAKSYISAMRRPKQTFLHFPDCRAIFIHVFLGQLPVWKPVKIA